MKNNTMKLALSSVVLLSSLAASANFKPGKYKLGKCDVTVTKSYQPNEIEIRVDKDHQYGSLVINTKKDEVLSINSCRDSQDMESTVSRENGELIYKASCGGSFNAYDAKSSVAVNEETGRLTSFNVKFKVAKYSLPNGMNSGPIKETMADFSCAK